MFETRLHQTKGGDEVLVDGHWWIVLWNSGKELELEREIDGSWIWKTVYNTDKQWKEIVQADR